MFPDEGAARVNHERLVRGGDSSSMCKLVAVLCAVPCRDAFDMRGWPMLVVVFWEHSSLEVHLNRYLKFIQFVLLQFSRGAGRAASVEH